METIVSADRQQQLKLIPLYRYDHNIFAVYTTL